MITVAGVHRVIPAEDTSEAAAMGVYVLGVAGVIVFYLAVLGVGIWAATVKKKKARQGQDAMLLANRGLGPVLGIFTLIGESNSNPHHVFRASFHLFLA